MKRFRATLAALMLAQPTPRLLMLDEPTNNLDLASVRELVTAPASYRGALIVASHDMSPLPELGITVGCRSTAPSAIGADQRYASAAAWMSAT